MGLPLAEAPGLGDHALVLLLPLRDAEAVAEARAQAQLRERAVLATGISFTVADARADDMPLIFVNPAFTLTTGYAPEEVLGRNCRFLQGPETDPGAPAAIRAALAAGEEVTVTLLNRRRDGTAFWNQVSINPIRDADGDVTHFVGIQHDVTERVEADRDRAAAHRAERMARERLGLLAEATSTLAATLDVDDSLERLARLVVPLLADWVAIHLVDEAGGVRQVAVRHRDGHEDLLRRYADLQPVHATERSPIRRVLEGADALLLEDFGRERDAGRDRLRRGPGDRRAPRVALVDGRAPPRAATVSWGRSPSSRAPRTGPSGPTTSRSPSTSGAARRSRSRTRASTRTRARRSSAPSRPTSASRSSARSRARSWARSTSTRRCAGWPRSWSRGWRTGASSTSSTRTTACGRSPRATATRPGPPTSSASRRSSPPACARAAACSRSCGPASP